MSKSLPRVLFTSESCVAQVGLSPLSPQYWDHKYVTPDLGVGPENLCMPGKHSATWTASLAPHFYFVKDRQTACIGQTQKTLVPLTGHSWLGQHLSGTFKALDLIPVTEKKTT